MLDEAGWPGCRIVASNALDEKQIAAMLERGGRIDTFGVGEALITAKSDPVLGCVYKLAAQEDASGRVMPRIKVSESPAKMTTPHFKRVYRLFERASGRAAADYVAVHGEAPPEWLPEPVGGVRRRWSDFAARELLQPVFTAGRSIYPEPDLPAIKTFCREQVEALPDAVKALENPAHYPVILSEALLRDREAMVRRYRRR
jgi:nicotinate phosphoribosyltransferase